MNQDLSQRRLRLTGDVESRLLADGTRLLKQTRCGEYLALPPLLADIPERFTGTPTVEAVLDEQGKKDYKCLHPRCGDLVAIAAKALSQPPEVIKLGINYFGPQDRVSVADMQRQIDWYEARGMLKTHIDAETLIDKRYAIEVPAH